MSDKKNQPEKVSKTGADLINAAKEGETGNPGPNVAPGTQTEPATTTEGPKTETTTIPAVPSPDAPTEFKGSFTWNPENPPGQPGAPLTQPTIQTPTAGAPLTKEGESLLPPVRQQGRTSNFNLEEVNQGVKSLPTEQLRAVKNVIDGELGAREPAKNQQAETVVGITYDGQTIDAAKGDVKTTFTKAAWDQLPKNKKGWKEVLKTPPEVEALKK